MNQKETVLQLIFSLSHAIKHYMRKSHANDETGITMPQHMVIGMLFRHQELKISELSQKIGLSNSTTSGIVDRLENQHFVERVRGEKDRRVVRVRLTPQFQNKHQNIHKSIESNLENMLSTCSQDELDRIVDGLSILKDVLDRL